MQRDPLAVFDLWVAKYNKKYGVEEKAHRLDIFKQNAGLIAEHNARAETFTMALNQFADMYAAADLFHLRGTGGYVMGGTERDGFLARLTGRSRVLRNGTREALCCQGTASSPDIHCPLLPRTYEEFSKVHMGYNEAIRTEPK